MFMTELIELLFLVVLLPQSSRLMPAYKVFMQKRNKIDLALVSNITEQKKFLGINWYIEYQKSAQNDEQNEESARFEPLMRIIGVTDKEIFFKKFHKDWFSLDPQNASNREILPHYSTVPHNPITAYLMENNQTLLTIALKNLTIFTFNLSQEVSTSNPRLTPIMTFNASYKVSEDAEEIRSIAQIPYSDNIIFTPSRFEVFKMNRLTNKVHLRSRSPLDSTNFVVTPVASHRPEYDPHNPNKKKDPKLSERVLPFTETTYFVMTSTNSGINALVDWTTMATIRYFSMRDRIVKLEDKGIRFQVRSICFFGGSPRGHLYPFLGSDTIKELFLFSALNRNYLGSLKLPKPSSHGQVTWINHTNYVYILQTGLESSPEYHSGSYFLYLSPNSDYIPVFNTNDHLYRLYRYLNPNLLAFDYNMTNNEVYDEIFDRLDYFYLFLTSSGNSIAIDIPPFNWDRCNNSIRNSTRYFMYYGRYRFCGPEGCISGYQNRKGFDQEGDRTAIQCEKYKCEAGKVMHVADPNFLEKLDSSFPDFETQGESVTDSSGDGPTFGGVNSTESEMTKIGDQTRLKTKKNKYFRLEPYKLKEKERGVANDNGCWKGFNLEPSGICRACDYMGYQDTKIRFYPSDCLLWIKYWGIWDDTLTYSYFHYNKTLLDEKVYYKGFSGDEYYYKQIFQEKRDSAGRTTKTSWETRF